jgi:hypothetical protein
MIEPGTYNFTIYAGANWDRTFTVSIDGTPVSWNGYTARMIVKQYESSPAVISLTNGAGITLGAGTTTGTIKVEMSATQTAIMPGRYIYDLELITGTNVTRILQGKIIVDGQVTA